MLGLRQKSTSRLIILVLGVLLLIYIGSTLVAYFKLKGANYAELKPSYFSIYGFPHEIANEKRWVVIITHEVPNVYQVLREQGGLSKPDFGSEDQSTRVRVAPQEAMKSLPVVLTEQFIEKAWVEKRDAETLRLTPNIFLVHIKLTDEGKGRVWNYARNSFNKRGGLGETQKDERLLVAVDDMFWAAPVIKGEVASSWWLLARFSPLQTSDIQIMPIFDEDIANTIVKGIEDAKNKANRVSRSEP